MMTMMTIAIMMIKNLLMMILILLRRSASIHLIVRYAPSVRITTSQKLGQFAIIIIFAIIFVFTTRDLIYFFAISSVGLKMNYLGLASTSHTLLEIRTEICCIPSLWPRCWTLPTSPRICQQFFAFSSPNPLEVSLHAFLH